MMTNQNSSKHLKIAAVQLAAEKEYWTRQLSGDYEPGYFPYDYRHPGAGIKERSGFFDFAFTRELSERLLEISSGEASNLHMVLTASLAALLAIYNGRQDIILGTSIDKQDTETSLINTVLPLRIRLTPGMTFKELLLEVRKTINDAIENQNYPIETLLPTMNLSSARGEFCLFDVSVILENIQDKKYLEHIPHSMCFSFLEKDATVLGRVEYGIAQYDEKSIGRMKDHLICLLEETLFHVDRKIEDIDLVLEQDRTLLMNFNDTGGGYPGETVMELFQRQAAKNPDKIAVEEADQGRAVSYRQLNRWADEVANQLLEKGAAHEAIVPLVVERSIEMIAALLGIWKTGAAYLPVDPDSPPDRTRYMLADSGANILITPRGGEYDNVMNFEGETVFPCLRRPGGSFEKPPPGPPQNFLFRLAYVIYTSGSTGRPKGVMIEHRSLAGYIEWAARQYVKDEAVNFPLFTSPTFDLTVTSMFTPLVTGNTVVIFQGWEKGNVIEQIIGSSRVGIIKLTPSHLDLIREKKIMGSGSPVKRLIVGGDKLDTQLARQIFDNFNGNIEIYNEYGPTEATVGCMIYRFNPEMDATPFVPIGKPADNHHIYMVNKDLRPVPLGAVGEMAIAGTGVARGYLNNPGLTAERFKEKGIGQKDSFSPIYMTGDLARFLPDGQMDFFGRKDHQVKIRGFRIELGEIEHQLRTHLGVRDAVAVVNEDETDGLYICAYVVPVSSDSLVSKDVLREHLLKALPLYMLPSRVIYLEEMPLTPHGKIDRKALPEPGEEEAGVEYVPPATENQRLLVEIWQDVLGVEKAGINHSYFDSGGDSIKAIQMAAKLQKYKLKLELKDLFHYPTIKELANHLESTQLTSPQGIIRGDARLTPIQEWFFEKNFSRKHHFNQSVMLYRPDRFNPEILAQVFRKLLEHHDALRMVFKEEQGRIKPFNPGLECCEPDIKIFDLRDTAAGESYKTIIRKECDRIQRSMDLAQGPLVKFGLFHTVKGDYLAIVIHHLVIDGVSWRILFEDFISFYKQMERGKTPGNMEIPLKTTPYKEWAEKIYRYSNSETLTGEIEYWKQIEQMEIVPFPGPGISGELPPGHQPEASISGELSRDDTGKLLKDVHRTFNTEINEILLTALGLALSDITGGNQFIVDLEGHGREEIIKGIDVSRTVGWFTSIYPVALDTTNRADLSLVIKRTKETLRRIPNKGIGYGILKYLTAVENKQDIQFHLKPEICFNYFGQFDEDIKSDLFQVVDMSPGNSISAEYEREYSLEIIGLIANRALAITINYDRKKCSKEKIAELLEKYLERLAQVIRYCVSRETTELTASDLSSSDFSEEEVNSIMNELETMEELDGTSGD